MATPWHMGEAPFELKETLRLCQTTVYRWLRLLHPDETPSLGGLSPLASGPSRRCGTGKIQRMPVPVCLRWSSGGAAQLAKLGSTALQLVAHVPLHLGLLQGRTVRRPRRYLRYFVGTFSGICLAGRRADTVHVRCHIFNIRV